MDGAKLMADGLDQFRAEKRNEKLDDGRRLRSQELGLLKRSKRKGESSEGPGGKKGRRLPWQRRRHGCKRLWQSFSWWWPGLSMALGMATSSGGGGKFLELRVSTVLQEGDWVWHGQARSNQMPKLSMQQDQALLGRKKWSVVTPSYCPQEKPSSSPGLKRHDLHPASLSNLIPCFLASLLVGSTASWPFSVPSL